ncbi:8-oxo-dGTP pyrophosphatase MutT (NUDIX family) [Kitasatospora sp. MAP12-15]|uniref:NUDIX hydrolase n=1 Tax=unclassified Kitasatospora TaxID=2633591 RepID=UPI00247644A4|nr:NUDIX hydrolase [Kitasatospora sp. MAP12-44]MDH6112884.1 8-oxo-dGTP pyrophosphatase MutT (NUDIX family) [Kitasatospora sp. MAP12-44]
MSATTASDAGPLAQLSEYDRGLPRKRSAAGVLFFDAEGRVLLVDPIYKEPWEIPGGGVEWDESPKAGAVREVKEELGLSRPVGRLLGMDWVGPRPGRSEGIIAIFDGGVLTPEDVTQIRLQAEELRALEFVPVDQVGERLIPLLARRVEACARARELGTTVYLENGVPTLD